MTSGRRIFLIRIIDGLRLNRIIDLTGFATDLKSFVFWVSFLIGQILRHGL